MSIVRRPTYRRPTLGQKRFVIRWDRILGSLILGLVIAIMLIWGMVIATPDSIKSGDRVCVAMLDANERVVPDAYYCGPLVNTTHDIIEGQDRP